jgi:hypothetical protein
MDPQAILDAMTERQRQELQKAVVILLAAKLIPETPNEEAAVTWVKQVLREP